jgi:autotransporter passenger strand-loop-strand repeat protein
MTASGGTAIGTMVLGGGTFALIGGAVQSGTKLSPGGVLDVGSGAALSGYGVSAGGLAQVLAGGTASNTIVGAGGALYVSSGGVAVGTTVKSGGREAIFAGGADSTTILSGGTLALAGSNSAQYRLSAGATLQVLSGYVAKPSTTCVPPLILAPLSVPPEPAVSLPPPSINVRPATPPAETRRKPPLDTVALVIAAPASTTALPPLRMIPALATPPEETISMPPADMTAPMALPPEFTNCVPPVTLTLAPPPIMAPLAAPPAMIARIPPLFTVALTSVPPDTNSVPPVLMVVCRARPPLLTVTALASPPLRIFRNPPARMAPPLWVPPAETFSVMPLLTLPLASGAAVVGGVQVVESGGVVSGLVAASGTLRLNGVTSIGQGATLETLSGGTALLGGTIVNSGVLYASGADSFIEILAGSTINGGGIVKIGDGIVDIQSQADTENVVFVAGGTGGLEIDDSNFLIFPTQGFGGTISGFGQNTQQFIDLTAVTSDSTVEATYTSTGASSGVLTVTSGLLGLPLVHVTVAQISFAGQYTTSSFKISSGPDGTVEITDPPVAEPGSSGAAATLALGGHSTLAPFGGGNEVAGRAPVTGGGLLANLGLFANYIATSFVTGAQAQGSPVLAGELLHTQPLLTAPPHR